MKLQEIHVKNFRCLRDLRIRFQEDLTILIGENDAGKSSLLDVLEMVLTAPYERSPRVPQEADYYQDPRTGQRASTIEVKLIFRVREPDTSPSGDSNLRLKATYRLDSEPRFEVQQQVYESETLNKSEKELERMRVSDLDDLLENELGLDPRAYRNKREKVQAIAEKRKTLPQVTRWVQIKHRDLANFGIPRIERYRAIDYSQPEQIVQKTLRHVYEELVYTADRGSRQLREELASFERAARAEINAKVRELEKYIKRYLNNFKELGYEPDFRFEDVYKGGEFLLDLGRGLHHSSRIGDGTKRRVLMAVLEWDQEIQRELPRKMPIIRAYDEPDTNLHYSAQKQFFRTIRNLTQENQNVQAVLCTHSVVMVDAAPSTSIVLLRLDEHGATTPEWLDVADDQEVVDFLVNIAEQLGITNSVLFYERCYLLVEGETEAAALSILYRRLYGRSMREDGIVLINLRGYGGNTGFLSLLSNKQHMVVSLLDADIIADQRDRMVRNGWTEKQVDQVLVAIGDNEFEDAFADEVWARVLNDVEDWQRVDGEVWQASHIREIREQAHQGQDKFSSLFIKAIGIAARCKGYLLSKPCLGEELAKRLDVGHDMPEPIKIAFERARWIARVES